MSTESTFSNMSECEAIQCPLQDQSFINELTHVYICVFFDGTGNNMYEQIHKAKAVQERMIADSISYTAGITYSLRPNLFKSKASDKYDEIFGKPRSQTKEQKNLDLEKYGMENYELQRKQAEYEYKIEESVNRKYQDDPDNMGGWKYSNIAILRSLTTKRSGDNKKDDKGIKGVNYNLYIEGSGQKWGVGSDVVALGMGVRREGVVGLVSKAVVFVQNFVDSVVASGNRQKVEIHFAVFGFSRGSTCGRLFSYLVAEDPNNLPRKNEFKQYLPKSLFGDDDKLHFLDDYDKNRVTVDFLGIYDTVSSIGFLQKKDNSTNYGISRFFECPKEKGKYLHFDSSGDEKGTQWYINILHGSQLKDGEPLMYDTPDGPVPNWNAVEQAATDGFWGDAKWNFHRFNARDYGLYSPSLPKVEHTYHICAMDEFRENFALVDLGSILQHCSEVFMPGCHSDIGGGFMYNDKLEKYTLRLKIAGKNTLINKCPDPRNLDELVPLSQDVLEELGWLTATTGQKTKVVCAHGDFSPAHEITVKPTYKNPIKKGEDISTINGRTTYLSDNYRKIEFMRFVQEGYSNVTLDMMKEKAINTLSEWPDRFKPFSDSKLPCRFKVPEDLNDILSEAKAKSKEGERNFVIPNEEEYIRLRKNYLHFSCTDELNLEQFQLKASGANIGNPPNWRKMDNGYLLCRLIYRGGVNDKGIDDSQLHYMKDCP